jgi:hypothetical protein
MINPSVQAYLAETGEAMKIVAHSDSPEAMYFLLSKVAGEIDRYINPARIACQRVIRENEGILP